MPKKSFPITPESKSYSDPYESYSRSWRERAGDFVDDVMEVTSIGVGIGAIAGAGLAYALSPDVRDAVNQLPEYAAEFMIKDIENGNIPGIGFGDNINQLINGQTLDQSEIVDGMLQGNYPAEVNNFPVEVVPSDTYTIPGYIVQTAVQTPGK